MQIKEAVYVVSNVTHQNCPTPDKPEYAFIGRSNVGKSSLINMLCKRKNLARISVQPGKTQLINHFLINKNWYIVDLPGYGYAKRSKKNREKWKKMISGYLLNRKNLLCTFVLIDIRIPPQKLDLDFINNLGENQLPFVIVFTKSDKLSQIEIKQKIDDYKKILSESWEKLPRIIISSARTGIGRKELLEYIEQTNLIFKQLPNDY